MIIEFNQEHFEAWLLAQPKDRAISLCQGCHTDQPGCLLTNFARETLPGKWICGWQFMSKFDSDEHTGLYDPQSHAIELPKWMVHLIGSRMDTTIMGEMQAKYRELFPDTTPEPTPAIAEAVRK